MFGLNRKQMEAERLARLSSKRKAVSPPPPPAGDTEPSRASPKRQRISTKESPQLGPLSSQVVDTGSAGRTTNERKISPLPTNKPKRSNLRFPTPTILRTHSPWHDTNPGIAFSSLIEKPRLRTAVFSSFQWDLDWLFSHVDIPQTKLILVMGVRSKQEESQYQLDMQSQGLANHVRLCFPPLAPESKGHSVMHSKLMLLFYEESMRIVVPTANLVGYDWGEGANGFVENTVFVMDLPRRVDGSKTCPDDLSLFGKQLREFLTRMNMQHNVLDGMLNFDFDATRDLGFVYSAYQETNSDRADVGVANLSTTISQLGLQSDPKTLHLSYVTATLGMLDDKLINTISAAATGDPTRSMASPAPRSDKSGETLVYFPTERSVKASLGGPDAGGTIHAQKKLYGTASFRKSVLRDFRSSRSGMLSHSKIMLVRGQSPMPTESNGSQSSSKDWHSWVYVGSANLTASAWGSYTKKGFICRNWECGVIVPGTKIVAQGSGDLKQDDSETEDEDDRGQAAIKVNKTSVRVKTVEVPSLREMFDGVLEIPMEDVDIKYGNDERPWFNDER